MSHMFQQSKRTAPRVLALHPMAKVSFGAPSTPYSVRTMHRRWQYLEKSTPFFRSLHRTASQMSLKTISPSLKSLKSVEATQTVPQPSSTPKLSLVEAIGSIQWNNLHHHFTMSNAVPLVRQLPSNVMAAYTMVINSREYELMRNAAITAYQLTIRIGKTAYLWLGLFLESREYYYLRYFTLLALEQTIVWLRYGLRSTFDLIRKWAETK